MAEHFAVEVIADFPNISFELTLHGVGYVVRLSGGEWQMVQDGNVKPLARGSIHWTEALKRAIDAAGGL